MRYTGPTLRTTPAGVAFRLGLLTTSGAAADSTAFAGTLFIVPSHRRLTVVLGAHIGGVPHEPAAGGADGISTGASRSSWPPSSPAPQPSRRPHRRIRIKPSEPHVAPRLARRQIRCHPGPAGRTDCTVRPPFIRQKALQHRLGPRPAAPDTRSLTARSTDVGVDVSIVLAARVYIDKLLEHLLHSETGTPLEVAELGS